MQSREFKFRTFDKQKKRMVYKALFDHNWYYTHKNDENGCNIAYEFEPHKQYNLSEPVMQYIELQDKNNKEIYEGDILKFEDGLIGVVVFNGGAFSCDMWSKSNPSPLYHWYNFCNIGCSKITPEIIGNVYENPDIITQEVSK